MLSYKNEYIVVKPPEPNWILYWWQRRDYLNYHLQPILSAAKRICFHLSEMSKCHYLLSLTICFFEYWSLKHWKDSVFGFMCLITVSTLTWILYGKICPQKNRFRQVIVLLIVILLELLVRIATRNLNASLYYANGVNFCELVRLRPIENVLCHSSALYESNKIAPNWLKYICSGCSGTPHQSYMLWCLGVITGPHLGIYSLIYVACHCLIDVYTLLVRIF